MSKDSDAIEVFRSRFGEYPEVLDFYLRKLIQYQNANFDHPQFYGDLRSGKESHFHQQVWEMMLGCHLLDLDLKVSAPTKGAPDFCVELDQKRIWIEAISPEPVGIPPETLTPPSREFRVLTRPHEQILLRWTSAIATKFNSLKGYLRKNVVSPNDCYVIAVNGCQLEWWASPEGVSQWPWAAEAALGIGPLAVPFNPSTDTWGPMENSARFRILKSENAFVDTDNFWSDEYSGVSAVLGTVEKYWSRGTPIMSVVHNPKALVPIPRWLLGEALDVTGTIEGDILTATRSERPIHRELKGHVPDSRCEVP